MIEVDAVDIIETNCYRPAWTRRAIASFRGYYPDNRIIVVDDKCIDCKDELASVVEDYNVEIHFMPERRGCGRALDMGLAQATSRYVLTLDHGIILKGPGLIEFLLQHTADGVIGIGEKLPGSNRCKQALGTVVYWALALWDREFILRHDLSFKLTGLNLWDGRAIGSCTTAQYLCYRAKALGGKLVYVNLRPFYHHERARDTFGRRWQSPHEPVWVEEGEIMVPETSEGAQWQKAQSRPE